MSYSLRRKEISYTRHSFRHIDDRDGLKIKKIRLATDIMSHG